MTTFALALDRARAFAKNYLADATGDDILEARWLLAQSDFIEGSLYQERNSQRRQKSRGELSEIEDVDAAIRCYSEALEILGDPPIDPEFGAKIFFDTGMMTTQKCILLDRHQPDPELLRSALYFYQQVTFLAPEHQISDQAQERIKDLLLALS